MIDRGEDTYGGIVGHGIKVDRHKAVATDFAGETHYFCSEHCLHAFAVDPEPRFKPTTLAGSAHEKQALSRYFPAVGDPGLEPGTSSLSEKRSNRLS